MSISQHSPLKKTKLHAFIVADIETLLYKGDDDAVETQYPYSTGFLLVSPGSSPNKNCIEVYYSEDYNTILESFPARSTKLLTDMIKRLFQVVVKHQVKTIYFHNLGRFDGILLLRYLNLFHKEYEYKVLIRDNILSEISVYSKNANRKRLLFRFRDSLLLLPGSLASLASNLCPKLGEKDSMDHKMVSVNNLQTNRQEYVKYPPGIMFS